MTAPTTEPVRVSDYRVTGLSPEQSALMTRVSEDAAEHDPADDRLRAYRVLTRDLIRTGNPDVLALLHKFYGTYRGRG